MIYIIYIVYLTYIWHNIIYDVYKWCIPQYLSHCTTLYIFKLFLRQLYAEMAKQERQSPERAQEGPLGLGSPRKEWEKSWNSCAKDVQKMCKVNQVYIYNIQMY